MRLRKSRSPKGTGKIKGATGSSGSRITGVGGYRPERVIPNSEIVDAIDSSDEWIRERSGITERRFARPDESVVDMAEAASKGAIAMAGIDQSDIDAVLVATVTHPYQTPAAAPILADRFDLRCAAFDISAACAGYCHGISLASDMVRGGSASNVLVVGVEKLSDFTDMTDRSTAFIFGDGAGAAIVSRSDKTKIGPTVWGSEGDSWQTIMQRESWTEFRGNDEKTWPTIGMEGHKVFRWAVWGMAPVAQKAMEAAGVKASDLDAFIPHQANMRIIDAMIKQLKLPEDIVVARDIATTANTSAASIPLATERMLREGQVQSGSLALQIGFGAGLVYAAQVVELP
ncbi:beta-ketoacyl-ACP synthase III [Nostocoides australiense]|uniref:Beta-ketoacyl-[acyl-carrier-protein] synthase III n=1 Tax=Nostocoides australiense Ben110 TaxID=1193182 RepID=W6K2I7_9MICO|nr:beta-ketoacyl-ACP synthase III [Tetrasphaera australiensis]CCH75290.1 3-oxoacyl-(acyl-carrier-protein) synthase 3 [Tetrasphaera australiensis Ben110]HPF80664.1 beta-ketoacyl-ACP synthase III [Tetrasphaera australiensis]HRW02063.1 beta-ketoacyl-ACP synthase III [Tetrasphaera sp.]